MRGSSTGHALILSHTHEAGMRISLHHKLIPVLSRNMENQDTYAYRHIALLAAFILLAGTVFYHFVEGISWLDAYYFSVVTLATVGYGDITPQTAGGKLFTTFYILVGVGIIALYISTVARRRSERLARRIRKQEGK
jgi:voltage-gated potassium channel